MSIDSFTRCVLYVSIISFVFAWFLPIVNSPNLSFVYQLCQLKKEKKKHQLVLGSVMVQENVNWLGSCLLLLFPVGKTFAVSSCRF